MNTAPGKKGTTGERRHGENPAETVFKTRKRPKLKCERRQKKQGGSAGVRLLNAEKRSTCATAETGRQSRAQGKKHHARGVTKRDRAQWGTGKTKKTQVRNPLPGQESIDSPKSKTTDRPTRREDHCAESNNTKRKESQRPAHRVEKRKKLDSPEGVWLSESKRGNQGRQVEKDARTDVVLNPAKKRR